MGENLTSKNAIDLFQNLTGFFKKVTPESVAIFTGTMLKPSFYDSNQPQHHTEEKGVEKERKKMEKKKDSSYRNFYIADFEERQKTTRSALVQTPQPRSIVFKNPGRYLIASILY